MTATELRDAIAAILPDWSVTINEQYMLNVQADDLDRFAGFIYVEELDTAEITNRAGSRTRTTHDVYFCRLAELDTTAEEREQIREQTIKPAIKAVMRGIGVDSYRQDKFPRGFDANEVLIHVQFQTESVECN